MVDSPNAGTPPPFKNPETTPFIYFDNVASFGVLAGAVQIELAARTISPLLDGGVSIEFVGTGHLRCSPAAAVALRDAVTKALEMLQQPDVGAPIGAAVN